MHVLRAHGIEKAFGDRLILRGCDLEVGERDRIGLVGVNGSGKSTLLSILGDLDSADHGEVQRLGRHALLAQDPDLPWTTVGEAADAALDWHTELLHSYEAALSAGELEKAGLLQARLDVAGWERGHEIEAMLDRVAAPPRSARIADLSGGEKRRLALARTLLSRPEVLLLDEPTNHLDADTVDWLQSWLQSYPGAVVLTTHDRYLLEAVAERIVEVEAGVTVSYDGSYGDYLVQRAERQAALHRANDRRLQLLRTEAEWAARSPAARSTKQKARLDRLEALREGPTLAQDRSFDLNLSTGIKTGRSVLELHGVRKGYDGRVLIDNLTLNIQAGERLGVLGPNGAGKSTLLRLLVGAEDADAGTISKAPRFRVAVLDQHRSGLSDGDTVHEAAAGGNDHVRVGDQDVHVAGYLRRFLFEREMMTQRVETLSGGERARLLLAKLLLAGCNLLLLDEPTNDLDLQTLGVLEEALISFDGAVVVVTHDRAFLDRVCTRVIAFHGEGEIVAYQDRSQYRREKERREVAAREAQVAQAQVGRTEVVEAHQARKQAQRKDRLSFKEAQELQGLPARIEVLEGEQAGLEAVLADPATYKDRASEVPALNQQLADLADTIEQAYARWEELTDKEG